MDGFFQLTEYAIKLRRNLMFLCITYILHTSIQPLTELVVFSIQVPAELLNTGIPIFIAWFGFNYAYYIYAETTQWKAAFIKEKVSSDIVGPGKAKTLIPTLTKLFAKSFVLTATLSGQSKIANKNQVPEEMHQLKSAFEKLTEELNKNIKDDIERIEIFENSFAKYNLANKLRYWILDIATPVAMIASCFAANLFFPYTA